MPTGANLAVFKIQDAGGTLRDVSSQCKSLEINLPVDIEDTTTFGQSAHTKQATLTDSSFSIAGLWDATASTGIDVVLFGIRGLSTPRNYEAGPAGSGAGNRKYTGSCVLKDYKISPQVQNVIPFTATFEGSGAVTQGVYP